VTTFAGEDRLPRVPLPSLEDSCARLLEWCTPLLSGDELTATEAAVRDFLAEDSPAHELQAALRAYDEAPGRQSWLDAFWPYRYLGRRDRIALNANFFFLFQDIEADQAARAAGLIASALNYKRQLDDESIPAVELRGVGQSMLQHKYLFSATRIPGAEIDTVRTPYTDDWPGASRERHIAVLHRGRIFRLDVLGADGKPHTLDELTAAIHAIIATEGAGSGVGRLTTKARAEWAASREALLAANADALDTIERALFCVCLEDEPAADLQQACDRLLHGDSGNRWFDKAVSLIVFPDGRAGINVEHCLLDGTTILAFVDALLDTPADEQSRASGAVAQGTPEFALLDFVLDDDLVKDIEAAGTAFTRYAEDNATMLVSFDDFGANTAKALKMSPDAFVQMAYQLAHRRAKGITGATYESIATRQYRNGRTEAMRVVTPEAVAFVDAMVSPTASADDRRAALLAAAAKHVARAKECQVGAAPEQHLWELQLIARRRGSQEPALFSSPGWTIMRDDYLSTSSAPSKNIQYFGFGSTSQKCIGVAYVLLPERFHLYLATPRSVAEQMTAFADEVRVAVAELRELLESAG
jgi:carnitine O-acetyltransferase